MVMRTQRSRSGLAARPADDGGLACRRVAARDPSDHV